MKKKVQQFVSFIGGTAKYSGNTRTMWVAGENAAEIVDKVYQEFPLSIGFTVLVSKF